MGAKRPEQLTDNLIATEIDLTGDALAALDAVNTPPREYSGWILERQEEQRDPLAARG